LPISSSPSSSQAASLPTSSSHDKSKTLVAVAASIGTLFGLTIIAILLFVLRHRYRSTSTREAVSNVLPFTVERGHASPSIPSGGKGMPLTGTLPLTEGSTSPSSADVLQYQDASLRASSSNIVTAQEPFLSSPDALSDSGSISYAGSSPPPYQPRRSTQRLPGR